jgi:GNAT superfamily N-acetyltransferase
MADVRVRAATAGDYRLYATLFPELGVHNPIPDAAHWAAEWMPWTLIAELDGVPCGYGYFQTLAGVGYVRNVVTAPESRGRGVGRALMDGMAERLRAGGAHEWRLNVLPDNAPALRLYERVGLQPVYSSWALRVPWACVAGLPVDPPGLVAREVRPGEDAELERRFDVPCGQLAFDRARPGRALVQLLEAGATPVGLASFDPAFPGAFPFKVSRPELGGPLLRALRPRALPEHRAINIVVEADEGLLRLLQDAGASLRMAFLHLRGPLPRAVRSD